MISCSATSKRPGDAINKTQTIEESAPREFAALKTLIMARSQTLPRRLVQIASYALDNPDEIAFGTAASIAAKAAVQHSTLVRLSQALGYQGFSDLQQVFRSRLRERVLNYDSASPNCANMPSTVRALA